jgi:hypothetical protein
MTLNIGLSQEEVIPDSWNGESAIILDQHKEYAFFTGENEIKWTEYFYRKIKIIDNTALEEFSKLYFTTTDEINVKIIKPDGSEIKIDVNKEKISERAEIPSIFKLNENMSFDKYSKIAIRGLEKGDIIEYDFISTFTRYANKWASFDPYIMTLGNAEYPILNQNVSFLIHKGFYLNCNSYNGAGAINYIGKPTSEVKVRHKIINGSDFNYYQITDSIREKYESRRFYYPYRNEPTIKFQAYFVKEGKEKKCPFPIGEPGKPRTAAVTPAELKNIFKTFYFGSFNFKTSRANKTLKAKLKVHDVSEMKDIIQIAHYHSNNQSTSYSDNYLPAFCFALTKRKIPFRLIAASSRETGSLNQTLLDDEITWLVEVIIDGEKKYYSSNSSSFSVAETIPSHLQGAEAYAFADIMDKENTTVEKIRIPFEKRGYSELKTKIKIDKISFKMEDQVKGTITETYTGNFKANLAADINNNMTRNTDDYFSSYYYSYLDADYKHELKRRIEQSKNEYWQKWVNDEYPSWIELSADANDFEVYNTGMVSDVKSAIDLEEISKYKFHYKVDFDFGIVEQADDMILLNAGLLIGRQKALQKEEYDRTKAINMSHPRTITNELIIKVPYHYEAHNLEAFNYSVITSVGEFKSSAELIEKELIIKSEKTYINCEFNAEKWSELVTFLDAAWDFTQQKVVFIKKAD